MPATEDTAPHLFIIRVWTDPALAPPGIARALVEHIPSRERRYFRHLAELQEFVAHTLSQSNGAAAGDRPGPEAGRTGTEEE